MTTIIVIAAFVLFFGLIIYFEKTKIIEDKDGNLIPDVIEEKVEEAKEVVKEVKVRAQRVAEEVKDVTTAVKEVVKQSKDVVTSAKGNTSRRGRKPAPKKTSNGETSSRKQNPKK
jgi:F0F1-type ATP synthase membrane subunit b/b'